MIALEDEFPIFAIQDGGQCFGSPKDDVAYTQKGPSADCSNKKGGPMANDVYTIGKLFLARP